VPKCHNSQLVRNVKKKKTKFKEEKKGRRREETCNATMQIIKQQCNAHKTQGKASI
jgi:hypothetical protein